MELTYKVQNYAWGKKGSQSKVSTLCANYDENFKIEENVPYAELWLGTHINGPSSLKSGELLSDYIANHSKVLGDKVQQQFGKQLPFLFKVLSVNEALSIQAHPSKQHAEELHEKFPDIYKDPNHKPELAIALTQFEVLCGFRPLPEIYTFIKSIPELKAIVGSISEKYDGQTENPEFLKAAFNAILTTPKEVISKELITLRDRFKTLDEKHREIQLAELFERLQQHYPDDGGCFMVYFFNYIVLKPFQAVYLGPNKPHCYLFGDCIECMACSDNVVRAGLTPKYIDVDTLCAMLIYKGEKSEDNIFKPIVENEYSKIFKPPVPDFAVIQMKIPKTLKTYTIQKRSSASILLVITGSGTLGDSNLKPGTAIFLSADQSVIVTHITEELLLYQSLANI